MGNVTRDEFLQHEQSTRDVIDVKRIYIDMAGDLLAGVLLSQIVFWHLPSHENGNSKLRVYHKGEYWVAKKREDWWDECRITPKQFDRAITELESLNLVVTDVMKFDGTPMKHIRIDWPVFLASYQNILKSYSPQGGKSKFPKRENRNSPNVNNDIPERGKSLTENTAKTTAQNSTAAAVLEPAKETTPEPEPAPPKKSDLFRLYENNVGLLTPIMADELRCAEAEYPAEWFPDAFAEAVKANVRRWNYIRAILERWKINGRGDNSNHKSGGSTTTRGAELSRDDLERQAWYERERIRSDKEAQEFLQRQAASGMPVPNS